MTSQPVAAAAIVLVHSSDLHIDDERDAGKYHGLIGLRAVLDAARTLDADFILLAGDTFDNHRISTATLRRTADLLATAGRPVLLLPGNHDPLLPDCLYRRAGLVGVPGIHVFGLTDEDAISFGDAIEIVGRAHRGYGDMPPFLPPRPRAARWRVVMAHGHYVPPDEWRAVAHNSWRIADQDLAATDADYVALGHWDRPAAIGDGRVPAYYSGSPDFAGTVNRVRLCHTKGVTVSRVALARQGQGSVLAARACASADPPKA